MARRGRRPTALSLFRTNTSRLATNNAVALLVLNNQLAVSNAIRSSRAKGFDRTSSCILPALPSPQRLPPPSSHAPLPHCSRCVLCCIQRSQWCGRRLRNRMPSHTVHSLFANSCCALRARSDYRGHRPHHRRCFFVRGPVCTKCAAVFQSARGVRASALAQRHHLASDERLDVRLRRCAVFAVPRNQRARRRLHGHGRHSPSPPPHARITPHRPQLRSPPSARAR